MHNPIGFAPFQRFVTIRPLVKSYNPTLFADAAVDQLAEASQQEKFFYAIHSCVLHAAGDPDSPWSMGIWDARL